MNVLLKSFILDRAIDWLRKHYGQHQVAAVIDEQQPAAVYGDGVLAWYVEIVGATLQTPIGVEVAIDLDGCVSVNRVEPVNIRLQHLWPQ